MSEEKDVTATNVSTSAAQQVVISDNEAVHRYRMTVDLRAIKDLTSSYNVYLRFSYSLFGPQPNSTAPAIEVPKRTECLIPKAFSSFEFAATESLLVQTLQLEPLVVEVLHKDVYSQDSEIGIATLDMSEVLSAPIFERRDRAANEPALHVLDVSSIIFASSKAAADADHKTKQPIVKRGALRVVVTFEDLGLQSGYAEAEHPIFVGHRQRIDTMMPSEAASDQRVNHQDLRATTEYQVAWELEMWKKAEEAKFQSKLKEVEARRLVELEDEWARQEALREIQFHKRMSELTGIETKLKETLFEVQRQDSLLRLREEELSKRIEDSRRQREQERKEVELISKRLKDEVVLEKSLFERKFVEMEKHAQAQKGQIAALDKRLRDCQNELMDYKRDVAKTPIGQLEVRIAELNAEKKQLVDNAREAKQAEERAKSQLLRSLEEISRLRSEREGELQQNLEKEREQLQKMRLHLLAQQEQKNVGSDRQELQTIRSELQRLMNSAARGAGGATFPSAAVQESSSSKFPSSAPALPSVSGEVARLERERTSLLQSASYLPTDPLILELDRRIVQLRERSH